LKKSDIPRRNPKVVTRVKDDELVLLDTETAKIVMLNFVAAFIWSLIDGVRTLDEIIRAVHKKFPETAIDQLQQDVVEIIQELVSKGFIFERAPIAKHK
jgi:hypothetical protein